MADGSGGNVNLNTLPKMVRWYSPAHLISTGWRSVVSELFGQYADQRIMQATIDGFAPDVIKQGRRPLRLFRPAPAQRPRHGLGRLRRRPRATASIPTYAIASLISAPSLDIEGAGKLPGGKLLVMGGDQVYPYPTPQGLPRALRVPLRDRAAGCRRTASWRRVLFVLPGNHDWYDGLSSFDYMFCKARFGHAGDNRIGGWLCPQHRSYFAIRLPHNWWIWGADIQLAQYLDAGQVLYFEGVAEAMKQHPTEAPKLILCTAEPSWNYARIDKLQGEDNLSHITQIAADAGARICAVIAGDLHHYSRYYAKARRDELHHRGRRRGLLLADALSQEHAAAGLARQRDRSRRSRCQIEDGTSDGQAVVLALARHEPPPQPERLGFPFRNYGFAVCSWRLLLADDLGLRHDARSRAARERSTRRRRRSCRGSELPAVAPTSSS